MNYSTQLWLLNYQYLTVLKIEYCYNKMNLMLI